jgi:hypothetical protein
MRVRLVQLSVVLCHSMVHIGRRWKHLYNREKVGGSNFVILSYPALGVSCTPTSIDNAADRI